MKKEYTLGIDTSEAETGIGLAVASSKGTPARKGENIREIQTWTSHRNQSKELLPKIDKLLRKHKVQSEQLKWVVVNLGPGSFTGLRVGISVANAFGYGLNIPVIGKKSLSGSARERVGKLLQLKTNAKLFKQVLPHYGRPPRITKPKTTISPHGLNRVD